MRNIPSFRFLFAINSFAIMLVILRFVITGRPEYFFLWWNLFLAAIPFGITLLFNRPEKWLHRPAVFYALLVIWIIFLPNAPYIITDLLHVSSSAYSYVWYDILMILAFVVSGLAFGYLSLTRMADLLHGKTGIWTKRVFVSAMLFACGFGVYLGRYHRFNSWELLHNPQDILGEVALRILHPAEHPRAWGMTLLLGMFLHILYYSMPKGNQKPVAE